MWRSISFDANLFSRCAVNEVPLSWIHTKRKRIRRNKSIRYLNLTETMKCNVLNSPIHKHSQLPCYKYHRHCAYLHSLMCRSHEGQYFQVQPLFLACLRIPYEWYPEFQYRCHAVQHLNPFVTAIYNTLAQHMTANLILNLDVVTSPFLQWILLSPITKNMTAFPVDVSCNARRSLSCRFNYNLSVFLLFFFSVLMIFEISIFFHS